MAWLHLVINSQSAAYLTALLVVYFMLRLR